MTKEEIARVAAQAVGIARANRKVNAEPVKLAPVESYDTTWNTPVKKDPFDLPRGGLSQIAAGEERVDSRLDPLDEANSIRSRGSVLRAGHECPERGEGCEERARADQVGSPGCAGTMEGDTGRNLGTDDETRKVRAEKTLPRRPRLPSISRT